MNFLAPGFFYAALAVAAGVVALHFIVTRQPPSSPLPTAQFVPEGAVETVTINRVPEDLLLLLLRVLLILLAGAAFARPVISAGRQPVLRVILADVAGRAARPAELADSVRAVFREGDALIAYDSAARAVRPEALDSLAAAPGDRIGQLSPALIAALRTAAELRHRADSLELIVVSPFAGEQLDAATADLRALWPGRARLVQVPARADSSAGRGVGFAVTSAGPDPVLAAAGLLGAGGSEAPVRIVRAAVTPADSVWAAAAGHTLVRWMADSALPGWEPRAAVDTVGAVATDGATVVAPFERRWRAGAFAMQGRVAARWVDGEAAAVEHRVGAGCIRDVAVPVASRGDLALWPSFQRFLQAMAAPCQALAPARSLTAAELDTLAGSGPLAATMRIAPPETLFPPLARWLLLLALAIALLELAVRRRRRTEVA